MRPVKIDWPVAAVEVRGTKNGKAIDLRTFEADWFTLAVETGPSEIDKRDLDVSEVRFASKSSGWKISFGLSAKQKSTLDLGRIEIDLLLENSTSEVAFTSNVGMIEINFPLEDGTTEDGRFFDSGTSEVSFDSFSEHCTLGGKVALDVNVNKAGLVCDEFCAGELSVVSHGSIVKGRTTFKPCPAEQEVTLKRCVGKVGALLNKALAQAYLLLKGGVLYVKHTSNNGVVNVYSYTLARRFYDPIRHYDSVFMTSSFKAERLSIKKSLTKSRSGTWSLSRFHLGHDLSIGSIEHLLGSPAAITKLTDTRENGTRPSLIVNRSNAASWYEKDAAFCWQALGTSRLKSFDLSSAF